MRELFATTVSGLEEVAAADLLRGFDLPAIADRDGGIRLGEADPEAILALDRWARGIERVGVLLARGRVEAAEDCYPLAVAASLDGLIDPDRPFAVRSRRRGAHGFGSPDIGREVGRAVIDGFLRDRGLRLRVDLDEPATILRAEVDGDRFRLWLDATGDRPLTQRAYRRGWHPAALRPDLAWLLLRVSGWEGEPLVDPMCGSGTIPIEAALAARGEAPADHREGVSAWTRLPWIREVDGGADGTRTSRDATGRPAAGPYVDPETPVHFLGVERSNRHLQVAWENVAAAGVEDVVRIVGGDAAELGDLLEEDGTEVGLVVTNPPFGRRTGRPYRLAEIYRDLADSLRRSGITRFVTLVERTGVMTSALEAKGYAVRERIPIRLGGLEVDVVSARDEA